MSVQQQSHDFYDHVIVGGGVAADKAARAIREQQPDATIAIYSESRRGPVYRPALTKDLWFDDSTDLTAQELGTDEIARLFTGATVTAVSPDEHTVTLGTGETIGYGNLLLATGARSRGFAGDDLDGVFTLRSAEDYERLRAAVSAGTTVAIVGGGYIATELAAGLTNVGARVSASFPEQCLLQRMFPQRLLDLITDTYTDKGVTLHPGRSLKSVTAGPALTFEDETEERADVVVLALGAVLNVELAEAAGLEMHNGGVKVDQYLATSAPDVYAAGDIANYPDTRLGRRHVEHVDQAERSGHTAGHNMAAAPADAEAYTYTPIFWSDMFDLGYEAVGELNTRHRMLEAYNDDDTAAVVYYLDDDHVRGVLLWNTWRKTRTARELLGQPAPDNLTGHIPPGQ